MLTMITSMWWMANTLNFILSTFMSNWTLHSPKPSDKESLFSWVLLCLHVILEIEAVILIPSGQWAEGKSQRLQQQEQQDGKVGSPMTLPSQWIIRPWAPIELLKMCDNTFSYYLCHFELPNSNVQEYPQ